ncbi:MAG: MFS transporter [Alphaproteobacteria bacterium]|nr:MFS transporter [Alphaproteobacteria bacterium]
MFNINDDTRKWWILIAMGAFAGLIMLDETMVGVALPTMRADLGMSHVASHWVVSVYFLVFTVFAAAAGKLGDIVGFKKTIMSGAAIFGLASLACGFADSGAVLIVGRIAQGFGAAVILTATVAMTTIAFPKDQRGMALGVLVAMGTTFLALGPLVGGFLTEIVSWHWIFWINVPIVALAVLIVLAAWVDLPREGEPPKLDYGGLVTLVAGLGMLVFAIMQGASWGWTRWTIVAPLAGGILVLVLFFVIERRHAEPLIEVDLFRFPSFSACSFVLFVGQFSKITIVVFGALYLQDAIGMGPLTAGTALLAAVVPYPLLSVPAGRLADKFGARRMVLSGLAVATLAMAWIGLAAAWDSYLLLLPGLVLWGVGLSFCYAPVLRAMANAVPPEAQGQTSGIAVSDRLVGGTIGMAICSTLFATTNSFQVVFLVTAALMFAALLFGLFAMEREAEAAAA